MMCATAQGHTLHGCARCGGLWLDSQASDRLTASVSPEALSLAEAAARHASVQVDTSGTNLPCPQCGRVLARRRAPLANVDLDHCDGHGVWFDKDELATVARSLAAARAYGGKPLPGIGTGTLVASAAVAGVAVAGAAAVGAVALAASQSQQQQQTAALVSTDDAVEFGAEVLEAAVDVGDVVDVAEVAGGAFEIGFSLLGALFDW